MSLFANRTSQLSDAKFTRFKLRATKTQHHALSANVTVIDEGLKQQDYVKAISGFQTQLPFTLHFGMKPSTDEVIDAVEIRWPSGTVERHQKLPLNKLIFLEEGQAPQSSDLKSWSRPLGNDAKSKPSTQITARTLDGRPAKNVLAKKGPSVVNFWAPWCKPCVQEIPELVRLSKAYKDQVQFLGLSVEQKDIEQVKAAIKKLKLSYPQFVVNDELMAQFFGQDGEAALPATFVFDTEGMLLRAFLRPVETHDIESILDRALSQSSSPEHLYALGQTAMATQNHEVAKTYFRQALESNPDHIQALTQLGSLLSQSPDSEQAIRLLAHATKLDPNYPYAWYRLAWAHRTAGKKKKALKAAQEAHKLRPGKKDYFTLLAATFSDLEDYQSAHDVLEKGIRNHPRDIDALLSLVRLRIILKRADAKVPLSQVLRLAPNHPGALELARRLQAPEPR